MRRLTTAAVLTTISVSWIAICAAAPSLPPATFDELISESEVIVEGTVTREHRVSPPDTHAVYETMVRVRRVLRGHAFVEAQQTIAVRWSGGSHHEGLGEQPADWLLFLRRRQGDVPPLGRDVWWFEGAHAGISFWPFASSNGASVPTLSGEPSDLDDPDVCFTKSRLPTFTPEQREAFEVRARMPTGISSFVRYAPVRKYIQGWLQRSRDLIRNVAGSSQ